MDVELQTIQRMVLPGHTALYYGGGWHAPRNGRMTETRNPATGAMLGQVPDGSAWNADAAVVAGRAGFRVWRRVPPLERVRILRAITAVVREHAAELAMLDAADGGNPVSEMTSDAHIAAGMFEFFAGLVTEMKGASIPMGPDAVNYSVRQPVGVVARIVAFNHPFMFSAGKAAGSGLVLAGRNAWLSCCRSRRQRISTSSFRLVCRVDSKAGCGDRI